MHDTPPPTARPDPPPAPNQFGLRGMFALLTASCLIFAAVSWTGLREPVHLLGALTIVVFCGLVIFIIDLFQRNARPRQARFPTQYDFSGIRVSDPGGNPFAGNPFRTEPNVQPSPSPAEPPAEDS